MADKKVMFKFGDGFKEVKVGTEVYWVNSDFRSGLPHPLFITKVGRKLITVNRDMNGNSWGESQFYLETGYLKTQYSGGGRLYSSKEAYDRTVVEAVTIEKVLAKLRGHYTIPSWLTYEKAVRILSILEEDDGT